jgi:simple sugar transport system permease protein
MATALDLLGLLLTDSFWAATLRIATPLIFGVLGALLCERAGVLNLGIEGIFVAGALAGWMAVWLGAGLWGGVLAAAAVGAALGLLHAALTVPLGLSQHVCGLAVTLLATSGAYFAYRTALPELASPPRVTPFQPLWPETVGQIPLIGPALAQQTALTWAALAAVAAVWWLLNRTALGLAIRAVGDNPEAVDAQGLSVHGLRIGAVVAGSALMGLGGAFLTISAFDAFFFGMVNGRGWICIALVIFASWRPGKALLGALLFAAFDAFQLRAQTQIGGMVPGQLFLMAPYLLSILALTLAARRADYPRALLKPWFKGQR